MTRDGEVLGPLPATHNNTQYVPIPGKWTGKTDDAQHDSPPAPSASTAQPEDQKKDEGNDTSAKDLLQGFLSKTWHAWGNEKSSDSTSTNPKAEEKSLYLNHNQSSSATTIKTCSDSSAGYWADYDQKIADGTHISQQTLYDGNLYYGDRGSAPIARKEDEPK